MTEFNNLRARLLYNFPSAFRQLFNPKWEEQVYWGGRGGGKSESIARFLLIKGVERQCRILCCREYQKSIEDSLHAILKDLIVTMKLEKYYVVLDESIRGTNGTEFIFKGLKRNVSGIKSIPNIDYCLVEEAENVSDNSWETLIPTIRKKGSVLFVLFNPKNPTDPTYQRFVATRSDRRYVAKVLYSDNPFFPDRLEQQRLEMQKSDEDAYNHIWLGMFDVRKSGSIYAKQISAAREDGRICPCPYDSSSEVFTAWDLGYSDTTAIWWLQWVGKELRWLECYENSGEPLQHYVKMIKDKPYNYMVRGHFLPHDGAHGNIRGDSVSKQLAAMGLANQVLSRETDINPGIDLVRQAIGYSVFDARKCSDGIQALESYGYEWNEDLGRFKDKPKHDWSSNFADAARYAVRAAERTKSRVGPKVSFLIGNRSWMGA